MNKKDLTDMLSKVMIEAAFSAELKEHLDYIKHEQSSSDNIRNGVTRKTMRTEEGQFELQLVKNNKTASARWMTKYCFSMPTLQN